MWFDSVFRAGTSMYVKSSNDQSFATSDVMYKDSYLSPSQYKTVVNDKTMVTVFSQKTSLMALLTLNQVRTVSNQ